jgi:HipA-like protein
MSAKEVFRRIVSGWMDQRESVRTPVHAQEAFWLFYQGLPIGVLSVSNGKWTFRYTDQFRRQDSIRPLVEFPDVGKTYTSEELWPFFAMRIPSLKQEAVRELLKREKIDPTDEVRLLERFGRRTTANPFELRRLVITCPTTGNPVSTGMVMDQQMFEREDIVLENNTIRCSACGQLHTWNKKDARLED